MIRPPFSPSEVGRVARCIASAVLPRVSWTSAAAETGTIARHRFLERVPDIGREAALAEIEDHTMRSVSAGLDLEALADILDKRAFVSELAMAFDWETGAGRELGRGEGRKYQDITATEIPGCADKVALVGDDGAWVLDIKPEHGHQPRAERHPQLRLLALMVARTFDRQWVKVQIVRPSDDGAWRSTGIFDMWALAEIAEETRRLAHRVLAARLAYEAGELPEMTVSDGCDYCPTIACPARVAGIQAIGGQTPEQALATLKATAVTPEALTRAYHALKAYGDFHEQSWAWLKSQARVTPIRIDDERELSIDPVNRKEVDGIKACEVLIEMFGEENTGAAVEIKVPEKAVERLIAKHLGESPKRGEKGRLLKDYYQRLEAREGLRTYVSPEVRVHKAKP